MMKKIPFEIRPIRGTTQIWLVTRHQYGISSPVPPQTSFRGETSGGVAKYRLFPQPPGFSLASTEEEKEPWEGGCSFVPIAGSDYYLRIVLTY